MKSLSSEVSQEQVNQFIKWGEQNHSTFKWMVILAEEFGEANKAILENDFENYREELVQVAAVALSAIESLDRNGVRDVDK